MKGCGLGCGLVCSFCAVVATLASRTILFSGQDPYLLLSSTSVSSNQFQFSLFGESNVSYIIERSSDLQTWSPVLTNSSSNSTRVIAVGLAEDRSFYRAIRKVRPLNLFGLGAKESITLKGSYICIDSFNSGDPRYSTNGRYDPTKAREHGDMASASIANKAFNIGNAHIKGTIHTGPGSTPAIGPKGSVGDAAWVDGGNIGIKPGWHMDDAYLDLKDVSPPFTISITPMGGSVDGTNYTYVLNGGSFIMSELNLAKGQNLCVVSDAQLYVTGNVNMHRNSYIYMAPAAYLRLYVGGASAVLATVNNPGTAPNFEYFGLPGNTELSLLGTEYVATVYAPNATLTFGGGGSATNDFQGACLVRSISANGRCGFHFDENLLRQRPEDE